MRRRKCGTQRVRSVGTLAGAGLAGVLLSSMPPSNTVEAAFITWTGGGGTDLWSDPGNWSGGLPANGDDLAFGLSARTSPINDFSSVSPQSIHFNADAPGYQLLVRGGGTVSPLLSLTGNGIGNSSGILQNLRVGTGQAFGDRGAVLEFRNSATVAADVRITNGSVTFYSGGSGADQRLGGDRDDHQHR